MADSGKTNEPGAAAAEPANGDQQVRTAETPKGHITHMKPSFDTADISPF